MELQQQRLMLGKFSVGYEEQSNKTRIVTTEPSPILSITHHYNPIQYTYIIYNLISSIGVIGGVFFGVSLIDFPDMVKGLRRRVRKHLSKMPIKRRKSQKLIHETLDTMKDEGRELNKELQNAKKEISFIKREYGTVVEELQNVKNDIFLMKIIENHMIKCLEKQEYESLV